MGKRGPKIRFNDAFHKEARKRVRESRAKKRREQAAKKRRRKRNR